MSDVCFRPNGFCCRANCSHPPECDHDGYGVEETPWRGVYSAGKVIKEYPGGVFCARCKWWLRESERPADLPPVVVEHPQDRSESDA